MHVSQQASWWLDISRSHGFVEVGGTEEREQDSNESDEWFPAIFTRQRIGTFFYAHVAVLMCYQLWSNVHLSVHLFVTWQYCIKAAQWFLVHWLPSANVLCSKEIRVPAKLRILPSRTSVSGSRNVATACLIVATVSAYVIKCWSPSVKLNSQYLWNFSLTNDDLASLSCWVSVSASSTMRTRHHFMQIHLRQLIRVIWDICSLTHLTEHYITMYLITATYMPLFKWPQSG